MAKKMNTSRSAVNRLFDPTNQSVTLLTLEKAAIAVFDRRVTAATPAVCRSSLKPVMRRFISVQLQSATLCRSPQPSGCSVRLWQVWGG